VIISGLFFGVETSSQDATINIAHYDETVEISTHTTTFAHKGEKMNTKILNRLPEQIREFVENNSLTHSVYINGVERVCHKSSLDDKNSFAFQVSWSWYLCLNNNHFHMKSLEEAVHVSGLLEGYLATRDEMLEGEK
jgi:hypothetical protein